MYVIAGVSGRSGSVAADALIRAGKSVRVVVRDETRGAPWRARGAEVSVASLDDAPALSRALAGADGAYLLSPQDMRSSDPIGDGWRIADAIARAIETSALPHLVLLSSLGADHAEGTGLSGTLHAAETRLGQSATRVTFLRAGYLLENWAPALAAAASGKLPSFLEVDQAVPMVSTRDVGQVAARTLLEGPPRQSRDIIELTGPRPYRPTDLADALSRLLGRPVEAQQVPLEAVVPFFTSLGASPEFAQQVRLLYQSIGQGLLAGGVPGTRALQGQVDAETLFGDLLARKAA